MAEGLFVDVEYRGIDLGRRLEMDSVVASGGYLHSPAPMPVGTVLVLEPEVNEELTVRVTRVSEQVSGAERPAGMFVEPHQLTTGAQQRWDHWAGGTAPAAAPGEEAMQEAHDSAPREVKPGAEAGANADAVVDAKAESKSKAKAKSKAKPKPEPEATSESDETPKAKTKKKRSRKKKSK